MQIPNTPGETGNSNVLQFKEYYQSQQRWAKGIQS
jgi:hypothetical protein